MIFPSFCPLYVSINLLELDDKLPINCLQIQTLNSDHGLMLGSHQCEETQLASKSHCEIVFSAEDSSTTLT